MGHFKFGRITLSRHLSTFCKSGKEKRTMDFRKNRPCLYVAVTSIAAIASIVHADSVKSSTRRELKVVMYPYVPDKNIYFERIKRDFEASQSEVKLSIVDLSDHYYDS